MRYTSEPFEVAVEYPERDGQAYPVIVVPPGVKTPVACKSDLEIDGKKLLTSGDVFVRSLRANHTPSTTRAGWKDWPNLVEICFDNREADVGRFLRRHLSGLKPEIIRDFLAEIAHAGDVPGSSADVSTNTGQESLDHTGDKTRVSKSKVSTDDLLRDYLGESGERFESIVKERDLSLPDHGAWEVALKLVGDIPKHSANLDFLSLLDSSNPGYTGWPVWLNSRGFTDSSAHPFVFDDVWEALIVSIDSGWSNHIDFMRLDPRGQFYLRRALQDDLSGTPKAPRPLTQLDFGLPIIRTAEAIAVGIAFAKAMECDPENIQLAFAFRWTKLRGRELTTWVSPMRYLSPGRCAYQDSVATFVTVPLESPLSTLSDFVNQVVQQLFQVFDGFTLGEDVVEELTRRLIERNL